MHLKISSAKWRPFWPVGDELSVSYKQLLLTTITISVAVTPPCCWISREAPRPGLKPVNIMFRISAKWTSLFECAIHVPSWICIGMVVRSLRGPSLTRNPVNCLIYFPKVINTFVQFIATWKGIRIISQVALCPTFFFTIIVHLVQITHLVGAKPLSQPMMEYS